MINVGDEANVKFTLTRLVDYLKLKNITAVCTSLVEHENIEGINAEGISSLRDTWINLRFFENDSERNLGVAVIKSRGMKHSNQLRKYLVTDNGIGIQEWGLFLAVCSFQARRLQILLLIGSDVFKNFISLFDNWFPVCVTWFRNVNRT